MRSFGLGHQATAAQRRVGHNATKWIAERCPVHGDLSAKRLQVADTGFRTAEHTQKVGLFCLARFSSSCLALFAPAFFIAPVFMAAWKARGRFTSSIE